MSGGWLRRLSGIGEEIVNYPFIRGARMRPNHSRTKLPAGFPPVATYTRPMSNVTQLLSAIDAGDPKAADQLLPLVYEELRKLAIVRMANEKAGQTLQATALVHEAWLKIAGDGNEHFANRRHFFKAAANAMQQILIDIARRKQRLKHGANQIGEELHESRIAVSVPSEELVA